jgi:hypothetical protein
VTVCAHRPESPGFFTSCNPCVCGQELVADLADHAIDTEERK